jgi:hypothetical protein
MLCWSEYNSSLSLQIIWSVPLVLDVHSSFRSVAVVKKGSTNGAAVSLGSSWGISLLDESVILCPYMHSVYILQSPCIVYTFFQSPCIVYTFSNLHAPELLCTAM